jgi:cytochrome c553
LNAAVRVRRLVPLVALTMLLMGGEAAGQALRTAPDTLARRVAACVSCHGSADQAFAPPPGTAGGDERRYFPRIAGKPAGYLLNQLHNFRDGRRQYPLMTWMVTPLSDDYLREIAGYFAAQAPAAHSSPSARTELALAQAERGRRLVQHGDPASKVPACVACHGARLTGALPAIPGLLGLPRDYINAQFGAWRNGTRRAHAPDCMGTIAARLSLDDVAAVSGWLASEPVPQAASDAQPAATVPRPLPLACGSAPEAP